MMFSRSSSEMWYSVRWAPRKLLLIASIPFTRASIMRKGRAMGSMRMSKICWLRIRCPWIGHKKKLTKNRLTSSKKICRTEAGFNKDRSRLARVL